MCGRWNQGAVPVAFRDSEYWHREQALTEDSPKQGIIRAPFHGDDRFIGGIRVRSGAAPGRRGWVPPSAAATLSHFRTARVPSPGRFALFAGQRAERVGASGEGGSPQIRLHHGERDSLRFCSANPRRIGACRAEWTIARRAPLHLSLIRWFSRVLHSGRAGADDLVLRGSYSVRGRRV